MMSVPDPFNEYHEMKHNSSITRQNQLEFWDQSSSIKLIVFNLIFSVPGPLL